MDINDFKYIVSSGCSYGRIIDSISWTRETYIEKYNNILKTELNKNGIKKYKYSDNNVIFIDVPMSSQGTDWQSDSIVYVVIKLLELGVNTKNIFCIVEWSQWSRKSYTVPQVLEHSLVTNTIKNKFNNIGHINCDDFRITPLDITNHNFPNIKKIISTKLNLKSFKDTGVNLPYINGEYYISPNHVSSHSISNSLGVNWQIFVEQLRNIDDLIGIDLKVKEYLNNILKTQSLLKENNIKYNFFHMQGCMSGWYYDINVVKHNITHDIEYSNFKSKNKNTNKNDIEFIWNKYDYIFNQIDFDNIWYYNDDVYRKGGIDEYSYSKYGKTSYTHLNEHTITNLKKLINIPKFGSHPSIIVYKTLWNQVATNCEFIKYTDEYLDFIDYKIFEDINYNGLTKNGLFISNKEFEKNISNV